MMGANEVQLVSKVVLPGAAPEIWTGMRVGFGIAWMCVVAAEMLPGTSTGLGYLIMYAYGWGQIHVVVAGMVAIGIIGILIDRVFQIVEGKWFSWRSFDRWSSTSKAYARILSCKVVALFERWKI
jgi:NitT/TauT family transport system permease protein